jgi:hypothetical protein
MNYSCRVAQPQVSNVANCGACHRGAEAGDSERTVHIHARDPMMEKTRILVWDLPLRVPLAARGVVRRCIPDRRLRALPRRSCGAGLHGSWAARIPVVLAFAGTRYARLSSFAFGPRPYCYLKSLLTGRPLHYVGHNPAGSWVIYALVVLGFAAGVSGYAVYSDVGGHWLEELHEGASMPCSRSSSFTSPASS